MSQRTQGAESQTTAATNGGFVAVGHRPIRHDGVDKVTGKALYGADIVLPGMLYGAMLRSPHAHARIISIDTSKAEANPDVKAVATSADLALGSEKLAEVGEGVVTSTRYMSNNVLAADKVLYKGHAVAAVAASNPHVAEEALALIDVTYEVLPAVTTAEEAMKPDAPILHDHLVAPSLRRRASGEEQHRRAPAVSSWGTWSRASRRPSWCWSASSAPSRCTRATSSPRTAPPGGRRTAT